MFTTNFPRDAINAILNITSGCTISTKARIRKSLSIGDMLNNISGLDTQKDITYSTIYRLKKKGRLYAFYEIEELRVYYKDLLIYSSAESDEDSVKFVPIRDIKNSQVKFYDDKSIAEYYPEEYKVKD